MCTAVSFQANDHYFGRTLDLEYSFEEAVVIMPRSYPFHFRSVKDPDAHYAMIGMAHVADDCPLYYEATNEKGVSIAGLNFPANAVYHPFCTGMDNVAPFEFIPWLLLQCASVAETRSVLSHINLWNEPFSHEMPLTPLHWLIADGTECITVECDQTGLHIYENPFGVLTNNPSFPFHATNLSNYMALSCEPPDNHFSKAFPLAEYSRGMGGVGLPGDYSSASRFVRAAFVRAHSVPGNSENESVTQFFHILDSVAQPEGCVRLKNGEMVRTVYSSCCNTDRGVFYYTTYENRSICCIDMHRIDLGAAQLFCYPLIRTQQLNFQN